MDTYEARARMAELAREALSVVEQFDANRPPTSQDAARLRQLLLDARPLLADAGFPGEGVWRGIQRGSIGTETHFDRFDSPYWTDVIRELREGLQTLESLISSPRSRDADFRVVG